MSANNWAECPRCSRDQDLELARRGAEVDHAYGKVDLAEYDRLRRDLRAFVGKRIEPTFREDYQIGIYGEVFSIDYHGQCQTCGFKVTCRKEQPLELRQAAVAVDPHIGVGKE